MFPHYWTFFQHEGSKKCESLQVCSSSRENLYIIKESLTCSLKGKESIWGEYFAPIRSFLHSAKGWVADSDDSSTTLWLSLKNVLWLPEMDCRLLSFFRLQSLMPLLVSLVEWTPSCSQASAGDMINSVIDAVRCQVSGEDSFITFRKSLSKTFVNPKSYEKDTAQNALEEGR